MIERDVDDRTIGHPQDGTDPGSQGRTVYGPSLLMEKTEMNATLRASRISYPRSNLRSTVLLFVAFALFGVGADLATKVGAGIAPAAVVSVVSERLGISCRSDAEGWSDVSSRAVPRSERNELTTAECVSLVAAREKVC